MSSSHAPRLMPFFRRLCADKGGNILMLTGFSILLLTFAVGFGIDYSRAQRLQTKLNAAADAAALAAVDPSMLSQSKAMATTAGQQMFDQQVAGIPGLTNVVRTVTVTDAASGSLGTLRTAIVTYTANSTNSFAGILKMPTLPIGGNATASASQPPSMNFYIALDTSPSMLLPTTSTGIANLKAGVIWSGEVVWTGGRTDGCDFACHASNMHQWNRGTYVIDKKNQYPVYLNNGSNSASVPFYRVSCAGGSDTGTLYDNNNVKQGTNASIVTMSTGRNNKVTYNPAPTYCNTTSSFNQSGSNATPNAVYIYYLPNGKSNTASNYTTISVNFPDSYWLAQNFDKVNPGEKTIDLRTDAESAAAGGVITYGYNVEQQYATANVPPVYKMQFFTFNTGNPVPLNNAFGTMTDVKSLQGLTFDMGAYPLVADPTVSNPLTDFNAMLKGMKSILPSSAGAGTQASPQNVLIIITDGAADNKTDNDSSGQSTYFTATNVAQCNAIKATGTRIAILYTQYLPETINYTAKSSFNAFASDSVPKIQAQLQACASQNADGSYLMQTVSTDGSVSTALNTLFAMSVQTARLVQ